MKIFNYCEVVYGDSYIDIQNSINECAGRLSRGFLDNQYSLVEIGPLVYLGYNQLSCTVVLYRTKEEESAL